LTYLLIISIAVGNSFPVAPVGKDVGICVALGNNLGLIVALGNTLGLLVALGNALGLLVALVNALGLLAALGNALGLLVAIGDDLSATSTSLLFSVVPRWKRPVFLLLLLKNLMLNSQGTICK
jgi:hypothetical protein